MKRINRVQILTGYFIFHYVFRAGMAITIVFGLTFGTILTMVVVPVLYVTLNRLQLSESGVEPAADNAAAGQPA